jgi:hypothetical protein
MRLDYRSSRRAVQMLLLSAGAILAACGESCTSTSATPEASVPVLSVPVVDLTLLVDFVPFGATPSNPAYKLYTAGDTASVRAAGPGTVVTILANTGRDADSEIHIRPPSAPDYLIIYDHVVSLQVAVGQPVTAGQVLGRIAPWVPGKGFTELQVNRGSGPSAVARCPREFGTADFNASHDAALARFPGRGASVCVTDSVIP